MDRQKPTRLLDGIGPALRSDGRYLGLIGWMIQKFLNIILWWWTLWFAIGEVWNLGLFVYEMVVPVVLYLQIQGNDTPSVNSPGDWRVRFDRDGSVSGERQETHEIAARWSSAAYQTFHDHLCGRSEGNVFSAM